MATSTAFLNLIKAAVGERYSLPTTNGNLDLIDTFAKDIMKVEFSSASVDMSNASYEGSGIAYRIKLGTRGIVIVDVALKNKSGSTITLNDVNYGNSAISPPLGYGIKLTTQPQVAAISGAGFNSSAQMYLSNSTADTRSIFHFRRNGTISATFANQAAIVGLFVGEWDGK